jgi:hypothetical protein
MRKLGLAMLLVLAAFATAAVSVASGAGAQTNSVAKPLLCETSCGGSWGAREHSIKYAELYGLPYPIVDGCENLHTNQKGVAQWHCWGRWLEGTWQDDLDPYGYLAAPRYFEYH